MAQDALGNVYVSDTLNHAIRVVVNDSTSSTTPWRVVTLAGGHDPASGSRDGAPGFRDDPSIVSGGYGGLGSRFSHPTGIDLHYDCARHASCPLELFVSDTFNHRIRRIRAAANPANPSNPYGALPTRDSQSGGGAGGAFVSDGGATWDVRLLEVTTLAGGATDLPPESERQGLAD